MSTRPDGSMTVLLVAALLACGSSEPKRLTSKPAPPTKDLSGQLPSEPQWSDLEGLLPPEPGLPLATPGLRLDMGMDEAREVLEGLALAHIVDGPLEGRRVMTATLKAPPDVAVVVLSDESTERVEKLQYSLPATPGERLLIDTWGNPGGLTLEEEPSYFWTGDDLQVQWITFVAKSSGLLVFSRPEAAPEAAP